jgi:hypothetical protein
MIYQLAKPRHDGPLRKRWRERRWPRRADLTDRLSPEVTRSDVSQAPDWTIVVEDAVLAQDMDWVLDQCGETAVTLAVSTDDERGVWVLSSRSVR